MRSQFERTTKRETDVEDDMTALTSPKEIISPLKLVMKRGNNSSRLGALFNHTIVCGSPNDHN
jgi:hypothetical protein